MDITSLIKGKTIPLLVLMILACSLLIGDMGLILPSLLFVGIIGGLMSKTTMNKTLLKVGLGFFIGSVLAFIFSVISLYYTEGGMYALLALQYSWVYIIYYILIGCFGGALGYHIRDEII